MLKIPDDVKTNELRDFFEAIKWKKFTRSVEAGDPERIQNLMMGRKSIADFCRRIYLSRRRERGKA